MSTPYSDGVVKRLNFSSDATPVSLLSARRGHGCARPRCPPTLQSTLPTRSSVLSQVGVVRYGLPEDEIGSTDRRNGSRSVTYRVPSDDESDTDDDVTSAYLPVAVSRPDAVEDQKRLLEQRLVVSLETAHQTKQAALTARLAEVEQQLSAKLSLVASTARRKQDDLQRADQEQLRRQQQQRAELLESMARSHRTEATLQEQQIKRLVEQREAERRKEEERRRREEEERRRREEEERRQELERLEAEAARERERQRKEKEEWEWRAKEAEEAERKRHEAEAAEKQRQEAERQRVRKAAAASGAGGKGHLCLRAAPGAVREAADLATRLGELQAAVGPLLADDGSKKQRRELEKKLTVHVQQICGTQNQVQVKCQDVYSLLSGLQGPWRAFAVITLSSKVLKQQALVQLNNKAAFPLALVAVKVSHYFPELLDTILALLYKACPLAVPQSYVHDPTHITRGAYYRGMGFEEQNDPSAPSGKVFESPDEYLRRVEGLMLLYGAIMQVDEPNRHGVSYAWSYLARALNHLPADRFTAKALIAVLRVAGYSLHLRYRGQFLKLLGAMQRDFLPALRAAVSDDIGALATLLESYVADGAYRTPPEGRNMPAFDVSSLEGNRA